MLKLGLTGGIGSGKSTVARLFAQLGAGVIDADAISREATGPGGIAIHAIATEFGDAFVTTDRAMDRDRMRALVFQDVTAKARLEAIIHPLVGQRIQQETHIHATAGKTCVVFDIPLLVESQRWRKQLDRVMVVDCTPGTQLSRVAARSGLGVPDIERIMAQQASRRDRLAAADWVLFNDGINMQELAAQVHEIGTRFGL